MNCPQCRHPGNYVKDSRERFGGTKVIRRRKCLKCGHRWTTGERIVTEIREAVAAPFGVPLLVERRFRVVVSVILIALSLSGCGLEEQRAKNQAEQWARNEKIFTAVYKLGVQDGVSECVVTVTDYQPGVKLLTMAEIEREAIEKRKKDCPWTWREAEEKPEK